MFFDVLIFELRVRFSKISTYSYFGLFLLIGFFLILFVGNVFGEGGISNTFRYGAGQGSIHANSPYIVFNIIQMFVCFGILLVAAIFGSAGYKDFKDNVFSIIFSCPSIRIGYLAGKFLSAFITSLFIFSGTGFGALLASISGFIEPDKIGAIRLSIYLQPYLFGVIPNLFFFGIIFFTIAIIRREIFPVYASSLLLLIGYLFGNGILSKFSDRWLAQLIDPFGIISLKNTFKYWSPFEKNNNLIPFSDGLLINRIFWISVGIAMLIWTVRNFEFNYISKVKRLIKFKFNSGFKKTESIEHLGLLPVTMERVFSYKSSIKQIFTVALTEFKRIIKSISFRIILALGLGFVFLKGFQSAGILPDTATYPVTYQILGISSGAFFLFLALVIIIFSGELIWSERDKKIDQIFNSLPIPDWVYVIGKFGAIFLLQFFMMFFLMLAGIFIQIVKGYYNFELHLYIIELFGFRLTFMIAISVLAILIQILANRKNLAHLLIILYLLLEDVLPVFGIQHNLFRFGHSLEYIYSDMNGYGPFLKPLIFFNIYWFIFCGILIILGILFYVRSYDLSLKDRVMIAIQKTTRKVKLIFLSLFGLWVITGFYIYYNTNIINKYETLKDREQLQAEYEKYYKKYSMSPQPRITGIKAEIDIYPEDLKARSRGELTLQNKFDKDISEVIVMVDRTIDVKKLILSEASKLKINDKQKGFYLFSLKKPLSKDGHLFLRYDFILQEKGFKNDNLNTRLLLNGTFLTSNYFAPSIGYNPLLELDDNDIRRNKGLKQKNKFPSINDKAVWLNHYAGVNSDWIDYDAILSTSKDQTALTVGELLQKWNYKNRRYFHYKSKSKVLAFLPVLSGNYKVKKDRWKDIVVEVYYDSKHPYNIERILTASKKALEYCDVNFSHYPANTLRIVEFPRYENFAQSFMTLIPFSEGMGFIAKFEKGKYDYVFRVTAHEVAHQWWAHQVIPAYAQGATLLSEVLSQYSACMIYGKGYDEDNVNLMLRFELERYLRGRGTETEKELPLILNDNQDYVHYGKGIIVMNAVLDLLGEEKLNRILSDFLKKYAFQGPPYPISTDLVNFFKISSPSECENLLDGLFCQVITYDFKFTTAEFKKINEHEFELTITYKIRKVKTDLKGRQYDEMPNDVIPFAIYDKEGKMIYKGKQAIKSTYGTFKILLKTVPSRIKLDPNITFIDLDPDDNMIEVKRKR